jgi:hypothetical protein
MASVEKAREPVVIPDPVRGPDPIPWDEIVGITPETTRPAAAPADPVLEAWQKVWRDGIAPELSTAALAALERGLTADDVALIQGATTDPPPLQVCQDWAPCAACALAYAGWKGDGLATVAQVEEYFARLCARADEALGEPAGVRWFLNWYDEQPRNLMRVQLLVEVQRSLAERQAARPAACPAA